MKHLPSAPSAARLGVIAALAALLARPAVGQTTTPTFVQGEAFSTGSRVLSITVTLARPVAGGDLLVGWFSQYNDPGQVQVSDNVNGAWTRAPASGSMHFEDDTGDIALYYRENSQAAPSGVTVTVSASSAAFLQGTVADYSGVALAGSLDQIVTARAAGGTAVDTGATAAVDAGELVFAALVTSPGPGSVTPGSSLGVPYTARAQTPNGSAFEEDITSSAAGAQQGTATLGAPTDWYAVCAVFHSYPATPPVPPSTPTGLQATSVASTRVALAWSPSSGSVAGYTVYRDGSAIGTTGPNTTTFLDPNVTRATTYAYSVDAFDLANDHSAPATSLTVRTPAVSPEFVQGAAASPSDRLASYTFTLSEPVLGNDLLVGWFGQYNAPGEVQVSDNINGPWTKSVSVKVNDPWARSASTTFSGTGDIALFYREHSGAAPFGLTITVSASAPAFLQGTVADYRYVAPVRALDKVAVSQGVGTYATVGPTAPVTAGELVVAAVITGGQPGSAMAGSSRMVPYLIDAQNGSASSVLEDILSSAAGPQEGTLTLGSATNWYMALATFRPLKKVDQGPTLPGGPAAGSPGAPAAPTTTTSPATTSTSSTTTTQAPTTTTSTTLASESGVPMTPMTTEAPPTTTITATAFPITPSM